jgi:hypothetical protein
VKRAATKLSTNRSGDIRKDLSESQLARIGSVAIAYNEAETLIDILLALSLKLHPTLPAALTSRINGIDGKIELLKIAYKSLGADTSVFGALCECLGENGFSQLKKYRDGVIHARVLDAPKGIGLTIAKRGKFDEILLTTDALDGIYERLVSIRYELAEFVMILSALRNYESAAKTATSSSNPLADLLLEKLKTDTEQDIQAFLSRYRSHQKSRSSLPPLPEFPDQSPVPLPTTDVPPSAEE